MSKPTIDLKWMVYTVAVNHDTTKNYFILYANDY